jgi:hypothetical protein
MVAIHSLLPRNSCQKIFILLSVVLFASCEEVIRVDLNSSNPAFVVEASIYKDSVTHVRLSTTTSFFSMEQPDYIEDASITISDGISLEGLAHQGYGVYEGGILVGTEGRTYVLNVSYQGVVYTATSFMHTKTDLIALRVFKDDSESIFNPDGESVFTIHCEFVDDPEIDNFYMIRFVSNGVLLKGSNYYLLTEETANHGSFNNTDNTISFSESIFFDGGDVDVELFTIDKPVYNYFKQLDEVLFWKRRVLPPTPYNPLSNIDKGVLGFFAAWAQDSRRVMLE